MLVRRLKGKWVLAAIRPAGKKPGIWALPKGNIGTDEDARDTAVREVMEETGATGRLVEKLGDVRYVDGRLGDVPTEHRHEIAEVRWLPLDEAPSLLAYRGEQDMARKAQARLAEQDV